MNVVQATKPGWANKDDCERECKTMIEDMDKNEDGKISLEEMLDYN